MIYKAIILLILFTHNLHPDCYLIEEQVTPSKKDILTLALKEKIIPIKTESMTTTCNFSKKLDTKNCSCHQTQTSSKEFSVTVKKTKTIKYR